MRMRFFAGVSLVALAMPGVALAQSTGAQDFNEELIIVTATTTRTGIQGVVQPRTSKAKGVLTQEFIKRQTPGQTINDIINQLPGVSFQNNDPFGSAGGTLNIRGFDSTRINQTFDGIPLNDSGNYALFSNQQLDPELIEQVNVNFGSTDVDSPTAAASGSTVNYRTRLPSTDLGATAIGSLGSYNFRRLFAVIDSGEIGSLGTRAFLSGSFARNDNVYNGFGVIDKKQVNARIYQPIGGDGDFISIAGHYNQNRNNFFGSVPLRNDLILNNTGAARNVPDRFPATRDERFYKILPCTTNDVARPGTADAANSCGSTFDERFNPSNTGNVRVGSRFTLSEGLILTVDPSFQYVKANGGGTALGQEGRRDLNPAGGLNQNCQTTPAGPNLSCQTGYIAGLPYFGRDLNGDGDVLDNIRVLAANQTQTNRYGVIASLRYNFSEDQSVRIAYSFDRARHRQTGEVGLLQSNGAPFDVFPVNAPLSDNAGNVLQRRDRLSYATLNQIAGEYRGTFSDGAIDINAGLRAPFFTRDLTQNCSTSSATGNVECFTTNTTAATAYAQFNPAVQGPQNRVLKYDRILPNAGATVDVGGNANVFVNYSKGLQVPGTDNLYQSFFFAPGTAAALPEPETTDNIDLGARYNKSGFQAQLVGWYTKFNNRLASAYDPDLDATIYRNLGRVDRYGFDGDISYQPMPGLALRVFGSVLKSDIQSNVQLSGGGSVGCGESSTPPAGCAATAGKRESGTPTFTFGGSIRGGYGPFSAGLQAKRTGPRYVNDQNLPITLNVPNPTNPANNISSIVYDAKVPAYTLVDFDMRVSMESLTQLSKSFVQFNVTNLFDEKYVGGFGGSLIATSAPFVQIGAPRAFILTLGVGF